MLRQRVRRRSDGASARVDGRTKRLLTRLRPGEVAVIDHEDLDRVAADRVMLDGELLGVGVRQSEQSVIRAMDEARTGLAERFDAFARNTLEFMQRERDLLFGGEGMPELDHDLAGRHVLVVVRGTNFREDLAALRAYISDVKPVLVGVDGGAEALLEQGYRPDIIVGDMDSVSEASLRAGAELVLHAYPSGR